MLLQVSMSLAVSEANFYSMKDSFISSVAAFLKINPRLITIVDVVSGNARRSLSGQGSTSEGVVSNSHNRALLDESVSVSFEVLPEASLSVDDTAVLETAGFANITVRRFTNVSC
jgi:hypothetical protein